MALATCPNAGPRSRGECPFAFVATDKRRQRAARLEKTVAEQTAEASRTRNTGLRVVVAAIVVLAVLFGMSQLMGDDDNDGDRGQRLDRQHAHRPVRGRVQQPRAGRRGARPGGADEIRRPPTPRPDALEVSTITEGEGEGAAAGDTIVAHYVGVLSDGTTFDESWSGGQTITVTVGTGQVIQGWDEG